MRDVQLRYEEEKGRRNLGSAPTDIFVAIDALIRPHTHHSICMGRYCSRNIMVAMLYDLPCGYTLLRRLRHDSRYSFRLSGNDRIEAHNAWTTLLVFL